MSCFVCIGIDPTVLGVLRTKNRSGKHTIRLHPFANFCKPQLSEFEKDSVVIHKKLLIWPSDHFVKWASGTG